MTISFSFFPSSSLVLPYLFLADLFVFFSVFLYRFFPQSLLFFIPFLLGSYLYSTEPFSFAFPFTLRVGKRARLGYVSGWFGLWVKCLDEGLDFRGLGFFFSAFSSCYDGKKVLYFKFNLSLNYPLTRYFPPLKLPSLIVT